MENFITSERAAEIAGAAIALLLLVIVGLVLMKVILKVTRKSLDRSQTDPAAYKFVINVIKVVCIIILATMCLGLVGIPMSTVVAVLGAAGAAIALALRDSLANVAGGMMIIITKPFSRDDFIDIGEVSGKVQSIDLFLTTLKTHDNKSITIPNGLINTSILVNHSRERIRRVDCTFGIGYDNDITAAKEILKNVCDMASSIFREPAPVIGVANHGAHAVMLDLKVWCDTDDYWDVKYFLEENVKIAFDEYGIDIPYPQMDVHLKKK